MFKKALQIVVTFGVLVGAYQVYLVAFALLTDRLGEKPTMEFVAQEGRVAKEATALAGALFGKGHWAANPNLSIRLYDAERGFYMYAGDYERLEAGKKLKFWPFAIIWMSKDGRSRKTATSTEAIIELNEPIGLLKQGAPSMHVVEARLEQDVLLRDDKGTADRSDDTVVDGDGVPLPYIEYTEKTDPPEIRTKSRVRIVDQKMTLTGSDLLILMRKRPAGVSAAGGGFDAETAFLRKDPEVVIADVGKSGVMPGPSRGKAASPAGVATPAKVKADGEMRVDLAAKPRPIRPDLEGPPELEGPTFVTFRRNVEVTRGLAAPDTLTGDTLRLTLLPAEKRLEIAPVPGVGAIVLGAAAFAPGAGGAMPRYGRGGGDADGPLGGLELREANATGFAVWLASPSQGIEPVKCNELIYKKLLPRAPDETYLRADEGRQVFVQKVDRDGTPAAPGPIRSVTYIWASDVKIFDDGQGGSASSVVARGPGRLESRPDRDKSVDHSATWEDELVVKTLPLTKAQLAEIAAFLPKDQATPTRREVTLTGDPVLIDHTQEMTLKARSSVFASLLPRPGPPGPKPAAAPAQPGGVLGSGSFRIERVIARERVRLTTPDKTIVARDDLNAPFEEVVALAKAEPAPASGPAVASGAAPTTPAPAVAANAAPPDAGAGQAPDPAAPVEEARKPAPEPPVLVTAHRVLAFIRRTPDGKSELSRAKLRGAVEVHQDPTPLKPRGTHAKGEALNLFTVAPGLMQFNLWDADPSAAAREPRLAARDGVKLDPRLTASIDTDEYSIRGPMIGLDQLRDVAWVNGPGTLTQLADRGFLSDKGLQKRLRDLARMTPEERAKEKAKKVPLTIAWIEQMRFFGQGKDPEGRPSGRAEFRGTVVARSEDYRVDADELDTFTDRPVSLVAKKGPAAKAPAPSVAAANPDDVAPQARAEEEPKPELVRLEARSRKPWVAGKQGVALVNVRRDEATGERIERQDIECGTIRYDKRTGDYLIPGPGIVRLYRRSAVPADPRKPPGPKRYGAWELTKVVFKEEMRGRFGVAKGDEAPEPRTADFYGSVATANGPVPDDESEAADIDFDNRPAGSRYMTSERLRIVDYPPPKGVKDVAAYQIVTADGGNVQAHDDTSNIAADYLHYDTQKGLFYAYGEEGRSVTMTRQLQVGHEPTITRAEAFQYNTKTKAAEEINPFQILLVDAKGLPPRPRAAAGRPRPAPQAEALSPPAPAPAPHEPRAPRLLRPLIVLLC